MSEKLVIDYYTDVLCIWAWIAQRRIDQLEQEWGAHIELRHQYVNVFGDTATRIPHQWKKRGGFEGFQQHVLQSAAPFAEATVNPEIWASVRPATSANAHLVIKAAEVVNNEQAGVDLALAIRRSFFVDALDIGDMGVLLNIASQAGHPDDQIRASISDGSATAALMNDYQSAQSLNIKGSPSWVMNNGRQTLYGNVGYKVLHANVESFLNHSEGEASWC